VKYDPLDVPFGVNQLPAGHLEAEAAAARAARNSLRGIDAGKCSGL